MMTGMNEAIMNQNDQMRMRILEQNQKLKEVSFTYNEVLSLAVFNEMATNRAKILLVII